MSDSNVYNGNWSNYYYFPKLSDTLVLKESEEDKSRVLSWTVFDRFLIGDHPYLVVSVGDGTAPVSS